MKKHLTILLTAAVLLLVMTACPSPPDIMGGRALTFGDHFMFDQTYEWSNRIWHLNSDGSYERRGLSWDTATNAYVQDWGSKGTYTYDNKTCLLVISPTHGWDWDGSGDYVDIAALYKEDAPEIESWTMTRSFTFYFTDNGMYDAYMVQTDGSWEFGEIYSSKNTEEGVETEYYDKRIRTYTISSTEMKKSYDYIEKSRADTQEVAEYRERESGMVRRMAPTDIEWKAGKTVTFYYGRDIDTEESWNSTTEEWDLDSDNSDTTDTRTRTLVNLGNLILEVDSASSKDFIIE